MAAKFQSTVSSAGATRSQIVTLRFMAETRRMCAIMRGGDVIMISIEDEGAPVRLQTVLCLRDPWN